MSKKSEIKPIAYTGKAGTEQNSNDSLGKRIEDGLKQNVNFPSETLFPFFFSFPMPFLEEALTHIQPITCRKGLPTSSAMQAVGFLFYKI